MKEAPKADGPQKQQTDDSKKFEETFRPNKGKVNFGVLKNDPTANKKRKSRGKRLAIFLLVLVLLLGSVGAALYFTGLLNQVLGLFGLREQTGDTQLSLEERETLVLSKETELDQREKSLDQREKQLEAQETAQETEDEELETTETFSEKMKDLSDEELTYLKKVSSIYSKMDPAQAAGIMSGMYDLNEISSILYYMQPAASALVLEQMETGRAADITQIMLN